MSRDGLEQREELAEERQAFAEGQEAPPPGVRVMALVRWLLLLTMAALAALSIRYVSSRGDRAEEHSASRYYCPMHPSVVQDHPGECPICGMSLVPLEGDAAQARLSEPKQADASQAVEGLGPVEMSGDRAQLIGMRTAKVTRSTLPRELKAVGAIVPTESGLALVQTRFSGWIEELKVAETGQLVQRGQLLARVYSPELLSAQQELLNARKWNPGHMHAGAPSDEALLSSARQRLQLLGMDPAEIAQVEHEGAPHRLIEIRAPLRGHITQKSAIQGLYFEPGTRLFDVADLSKVWIFVELAERDAGRVKHGQAASVELTAYPGETFAGKVQLVYPTLNSETRTQRARIELRNGDLRLRPGMFGDVLIQLEASEGLTVPREAVVDTGERQYVFVAEDAGRFVPRVVTLGIRTQDRVQILAGLSEGEIVVTSGNFLLDSESRLRSAIEGHAPKE